MYRIIHTSKYWVSASGVLIVASILVWLLWGFNLGIDFTGGTSMEIKFPNNSSRPTVEQLQTDLQELGLNDVRIQPAGDANVILKMQQISNEQREQIIGKYNDQQVVEENFSSVGPTLGSELKRKAIIALILVLLAIIGYVSYAFRTISKASIPSWVFGLGAIVALVHDIIIIVGIFIILGKFLDVQIDAYFVTALLTILGFSVNDTIVVYDRIREGLKHRAKKSFKEIVNESINATIARSLNTSLTTLLVLTALFMFGGASIHYFVLALMFGVIVGTYSSIFIASPLLLLSAKILKK